jgi:flagellar biosynthesis/type III secretory pathway protein FliH
MRADLESSSAVDVRRDAFGEGYEQARQELEQQAYRLAETMTAEQIAHVRAQQSVREASSYQRGYQQGVAHGRSQGQAAQSRPSKSPPGGITVDQVLNECHIIGESNPQMKPAMNALRHRIKKLK